MAEVFLISGLKSWKKGVSLIRRLVRNPREDDKKTVVKSVPEGPKARKPKPRSK